MEWLLPKVELLDYVMRSTEEGVVLLDDQLRVHYMNRTAQSLFEIDENGYRGKHFYRDLLALNISTDRKTPVLQEVLETGKAERGLRRQTKSGRHLDLTVIPLLKNGRKKGLLLSSRDVTPYIEMERELDLAFALTLPNSKVEHKLKSIVEYQDVYDPTEKQITITGAIADGGYRHVVNCLKLFSALVNQGVTKVIGIDKDLLVNAFIYHDLGKSQPILRIGDQVDPREVFEDGKLHAFRGAEIAAHYYGQGADITDIIRYHHHSEEELSPAFPWRLLPMFRLFQLVDGLSAAITRGGVVVNFCVRDCVVQVSESNQRPQYDGIWEIDLYTGRRERVASTHDAPPRRIHAGELLDDAEAAQVDSLAMGDRAT